MKIVVLDGYTLNPGDLSWRALEQLGNFEVYDRTSQEEVLPRIQHANIVLTNKVKLTRDAIQHASKLEYIGVLATGYNVVDVEAAKQQNIIVTNVPAYSTASVAQHTFALLMELVLHVGLHSQSVKEGEWTRCSDFSYWKKPLIDLHGKTMGIVGLGRIGKAVARIGIAFGMNVVASHKHPERDKMEGVTFTSLANCCAQADVLSLHCPLNEENKGFINKELLSSMKPSAFFINVSRGQLVNEHDLAEALNMNKLAGAGLDVLSEEPPSISNPLISAKNCIITPHIAWATQASRGRLLNTAVENLKKYLSGTPQNIVTK